MPITSQLATVITSSLDEALRFRALFQRSWVLASGSTASRTRLIFMAQILTFAPALRIHEKLLLVSDHDGVLLVASVEVRPLGLVVVDPDDRVSVHDQEE